MHGNPFRVGEHVTGPFFTDRADEVARVRRAMLDPSRLLVYGPRRVGKSSIIAVAAEGARREGALVVRADLSTVTTYLDITSRLLRSLYAETRSLGVALEELFRGLQPRVTLTPDPGGGPPALGFGVERRRLDSGEQRESLESAVARLSTLRAEAGRPITVVFDEFQAVRALGDEPAEWHLRDLIQRHGELSFICAGSRETLIHEMIGPKRAFYKMLEPMHIGPMDAGHLSRWIDSRLATAGPVERGVGAAVVDRAGPRTQDILQVARQLWFRSRGVGRVVRAGDIDAAFDDVLANEEPAIRGLWAELSDHQQDVLRVVALGAEQLYSAATRDRYGLPAASSVQRAVDALVGRSLLVRDDDRIVFDSPFVEAWVLRETAPDLG
ncbi:MAG: AAA family ATPase [Candidatus Longimicrobiales bacterium M2_2A_002]